MANTLDAKRFGLAGGILGALIMLVWTLIAANTGYGAEILELIATVYIGYSVTNVGAFIGAVYCFIDSFVGLYLLAWLYNWLSDKI